MKKLTRKQQHKATDIENKNGSLLTNNAAVLKRWTEYGHELYSYKMKPDTSILKSKTNNVDESDDMQVMKEEVEAALRTLKGEKLPSTDTIPVELLEYSGPEMMKVLTTLCQRIWKTKEWTQSMIMPLPKNGNRRLCKNYRTIRVITHPSKIML